MNTLIAAAIRCLLMLLVPTAGYAISAQWDLDPISGDWNTADNWTPNGVPNGPADIATFGLSNSTIVDISEDTEVNGIIFTPAATNPYDIFIGSTLTISGVGITNNSGKTQFFEIDFGTLNFTNSATAGNNVVITAQAFYGGSTNFFDRSSAGSAGLNVRDDSILSFFDNSTAGDATISVTSSEGGRRLYHSSTILLQATRQSPSHSSRVPLSFVLPTFPLLATRLSPLRKAMTQALFFLKTFRRAAQREFSLFRSSHMTRTASST